MRRRVQRGQGQRTAERRDGHAGEGPCRWPAARRGARRPASVGARDPGQEDGHRSVSPSRRRRSSRRTWPAPARPGRRAVDAVSAAVIFAAGRGDQPPLRAEAVVALAAGQARAGVADEVVQRVTVVGHLLGAVGPGDRAQVAGLRAAGSGHRAGGRHRRPGARARARAGGHVRAVLGPQVHRATRPIGQERPRRPAWVVITVPVVETRWPSCPRPGRSRRDAARRCRTPRPAPAATGTPSLTGIGSRASSEWTLFTVSSRAPGAVTRPRGSMPPRIICFMPELSTGGTPEGIGPHGVK